MNRKIPITPTEDSLEDQERNRNRDPKTGLSNDKEQIGALAGTGAGIAAGAAIGSIVPGVGTAIGAVVGGAIGAVTGALGGAAIGGAIEEKEHDAYWREHYAARPYAKDHNYTKLEPAYRHGWEARARHDDKTGWDDVEPGLSRDWDSSRSPADLDWTDARHAARDAWDQAAPRFSPSRENDRSAARENDRSSSNRDDNDRSATRDNDRSSGIRGNDRT